MKAGNLDVTLKTVRVLVSLWLKAVRSASQSNVYLLWGSLRFVFCDALEHRVVDAAGAERNEGPRHVVALHLDEASLRRRGESLEDVLHILRHSKRHKKRHSGQEVTTYLYRCVGSSPRAH